MSSGGGNSSKNNLSSHSLLFFCSGSAGGSAGSRRSGDKMASPDIFELETKALPKHMEVQLRLLNRQLNGLHLYERYSTKNEIELLKLRNEPYGRYTDIGFECPLLSAAGPEDLADDIMDHQLLRGHKLAKTLNLWRGPGKVVPQASPYINGSFINFDEIPYHLRLKLQPRPTPEKGFDYPTKSKTQGGKFVTWKTGAESSSAMPRASPRTQRDYSIGLFPKIAHDQSPLRIPQIGVSVKAPRFRQLRSVGASRPSDPHPVTSGLRRHKTGPEQKKWKTLKFGEMSLEKVWTRDLCDPRPANVIQMAWHDTGEVQFEVERFS